MTFRNLRGAALWFLVLGSVSVPAGAEAERSLAVIGIASDAAGERVIPWVEEIARQALRQDPRYRLDSPFPSSSDAATTQIIEDAQAATDRGKAAYDELETEAAIQHLTHAVDLFLAHIDRLPAKQTLHRALALLASVHHQSGNLEEAKSYFGLLATLAPAYTLNERDHPPSDLRLLSEIQEALAFAEPTDVFQIRTEQNPGAAVWVDGVYRGSTPVLLENLEPGSHAYLLQRSGYARTAGRFEVGKVSSLGLSVAALPQTEQPLAAMAEAQLALQSNDRDLQVSAIQALYRRLGASVPTLFVVVVEDVASAGGKGLLAARMEPGSEEPFALRHIAFPAEPDEASVVAVLHEILDVSEPEPWRLPTAAADTLALVEPPSSDVVWWVTGATGGAVILAVATMGTLWWSSQTSSASALPPGYDAEAVGRRHILGY